MAAPDGTCHRSGQTPDRGTGLREAHHGFLRRRALEGLAPDPQPILGRRDLKIEGAPVMNARKLAATKLSIVTLVLAIAGFANPSAAQETQKLFIEGDIVRGNTPAGITGPVCVLANQFKRRENVVFRIRVRSAAGEPLDDKNIKAITVELADGQQFQAAYRSRPPAGVRSAFGLSEPTDYFWSAAWLIPPDYPTGSLSYRVVASDTHGNTQSWTPFKDPRSLPMVMPGEVEYVK
jgi:hypothetical protein